MGVSKMRFEPVQSYETTIRDNGTNSSFVFFTVPRRSLPENYLLLEGSQGAREVALPQYVLEELNLRGLPSVQNIGLWQLDRAIGVLLSPFAELHTPIYDTSWFAGRDYTLKALLESDDAIPPEISDFSKYLLHEAVIPFERSPLEGASLFNIVSHASGVGIGAYIGFVLAGSTPLLLITVPAGMILCGAAAGAARGLEEGLHRRIERLLSGRRVPA
jgi:hypothetical protein